MIYLKYLDVFKSNLFGLQKSEVFTWRCLCFFIFYESHSNSNQRVDLAAAENLAALFILEKNVERHISKYHLTNDI